MKIRGKLILSFGTVTLLFLLVFAAITYVTFTETVRRDREQVLGLQLRNLALRLTNDSNAFLAALAEGPLPTSSIRDDNLFTLAALTSPGGQQEFVAPAVPPALLSSLTAEVSGRSEQSSGQPAMIRSGGAVFLGWPLQCSRKGQPPGLLVLQLSGNRLQSVVRAELGMKGARLIVSASRGETPLLALSAAGAVPLRSLRQQARETLLAASVPQLGWTLRYQIPNLAFLNELASFKNRMIAATIALGWVAVWVILILAYRLARPIMQLNRASQDIIAFNYWTPLDFVPKDDEIGDLARSFETMRCTISDLVAKDPLTGLFNRRYLDHALETAVARAERHEEDLACLMLDLDNFKWFNDRYGHSRGDKALRHVGSVLLQEVRSYDIVARYGGEEFTVLLPATGTAAALAMAERLRAAIEHASLGGVVDEESLSQTVSIGVAVFRQGIDRPADLMSRADKVLYRAKSEGRNCVVLADEEDGQDFTGG